MHTQSRGQGKQAEHREQVVWSLAVRQIKKFRVKGAGARRSRKARRR